MPRPRPIQFIEWRASQQKATPLVRFGSFSSDRRGRDTQGMSASPRKRTLGVKYSPELPPNDRRGRPLHCGGSIRPMSAQGRYCCKSLFALVITIPPGCRRDFRVKMWGTSSPDDKLTGDLGNVIETTQIGGRRSDRLTAGNLSPGNFGLLQHN